MFAAVQPEEVRRLLEVLREVNTLEDALKILGPADPDYTGGLTVLDPERGGEGPTLESFRTLTYTRLSDTLDVVLTDLHKERVSIKFRGKYVGPPLGRE